MRDRTPDSHDFPTAPYDLVKEFVIALTVVGVLSLALAAIFSSPDDPPLTLRGWAQNAPTDVIATATSELAGTSTSATYGPPYNHASSGQTAFGIPLQRWFGVHVPIDSAALVLDPLREQQGNATATAALAAWDGATAGARTAWATKYGDALAAAPGNRPDAVKAGDYGPVPQLAASFLALARSGGLEGALASSGNFYGGDQTRTILLLSDGAYLENQARAIHLGGDQWGMMNETGNYPGQPWMWLYTFWYQVPPFSTSDNADAQVWLLMMVLTAGLVLVPVIPGLRDIPRWVPLHRLIWRDYHRRYPTG